MSELGRNIWTVARVFFARLRFVAVFVFAALVVGYWDNIKNHYDKWTRRPIAPDSLAHASASNIEFYCPMHPDVIRDDAGQCPKCGMPLVKRKKGEAQQLPPDVLARVNLTPRRMALAGIGTSAVESRELLREIRSVGVLDYDETRIAQISARVPGRADELSVQYTGQSVKKGDPLYSLYSPEVFTSLRQYLMSRKRVNELPKDVPDDAKMDASTDYNATMQKLVLWGVSREQLDQFDEEYDRTGKTPTNLTVNSPIDGIVVKKDINPGQYLQVGETPYIVADLSRLWLQLKLYERDIPLVQIGDTVEIIVEAFPNDTFIGTITFKAFQLDPETRTLDARVEVENPGLRLSPGMFADAVVRVPVNSPPAMSTTQPGPTTASSVSMAQVSKAFEAALKPYLEAQQLLSQDKPERVSVLLKESLAKLEGVAKSEVVSAPYQRLVEAIKKSPDQPLEDLRKTFKEVSAAMIEIGKRVGVSSNSPAINIINCSMKKADWLQAGDKISNPYYGSQMFSCGTAVGPLPKASQKTDAQPTTAPSINPTPTVTPAKLSEIYRDGLAPYLQAQKLLAEDQADGVSALLQQSVTKLAPIGGVEAVKENFGRFAEAVKATKDQPLAELRKSFKEVSAALIDIGKAVGIPAQGPGVRVFRCPMKKANWLQEGDATANPYYGAEMFNCGSAVESLPRTNPNAPATRPAPSSRKGRSLGVPRSAVIDTGRNKIVYVESSPGVFDMHAVKLGPLAIIPGNLGQPPEEFYPIVEGLDEGGLVVTVGTFLVDAENRLNPSKVSNTASGMTGNPTGDKPAETSPKTGHQHGM